MLMIPALTELSMRRLGQLSMALEIHERRRFQVRRDPHQLLDLLNVAVESLNDHVTLRLGEFIETLSPETHRQLVISGARLHTYRGVQHDGQKKPDPVVQKPTSDLSCTYRGVAIGGPAPDSSKPDSSESVDPRFAMTYRGRRLN